MKNFFKTIITSFYSSELYKKAKDESSKQGVKFIIKLSVFLGLVFGIIGLVVFLTFSATLKKLATNFVDKSYPNELIVTVKDGTLTSNITEPIFIPLPTGEEKVKAPKNLTALVPNEKAEVSVLDKYDTVSAITSNGVVFLENGVNSGQVKTYTYQKTNQVFTKNFVLEKSAQILKIIATVAAVGIIPMLVLVFLMISFGNLLALFLIALLIYLVMKLRKIAISYKESYRMGIYTLGPLLILQILTCSFHFIGILFSSVVVLVIILIATRKWGKEEKPEGTKTPKNFEELN